jgi:predicted ester cyclase
MSIKENKELVRRYLSADANEIQKDKAKDKDEYHSPEFKLHMAMGDMNLKEYLQLMDTLVSAFPDCKYSIDDIIAEGDKVVGRYHFTGTHKGTYMGMPATGNRVTYAGIGIFKIAGGKFVEAWFAADTMSMMQQLGAIPKR